MEVDFADLSDEEVDDDQMKGMTDEFEFDDTFFKKTDDKAITDVHKKLMEYKTKFEKVGLYALMDLNAEYLNYYNGLKEVKFEDDNTYILDVPIIKMDVEQIDEIIMKKQEQRKPKEPPKKKESKSFFKSRFGY